MTFAKFVRDDVGTSFDRDYMARAGLVKGNYYPIGAIMIGQSFTYVDLKQYGDGFNSVFFDFFDGDGNEYDPWGDVNVNPYLSLVEGEGYGGRKDCSDC